MPFTIPNAADAGNTNQAEPDKVDFDIVTAGSTETGVVSGCAVTPTTLLTLDVAAGVIAVLGVVATVTSGTVVVGTADVTNPRFDLVVVNSSGTKSVTAGTAAAEPVYPAVPASSVCLAAVYVPALLATILAGNIVDKRVIVIPSVPKATGTAAGDTIIYTASGLVTRLAIGTAAGKAIVADPNAANKVSVNFPQGIDEATRGTSGSLASTYDRRSLLASATTNAGTSGTLRLYGVMLPKGLSVTSIAFWSGTTALGGGSNQWFGLFDSARVVLAKTADDTTAAWGASTPKPLAVTSGPFVTTYAGWHYIGILVVATTMPTIESIGGMLATGARAAAPIPGGSSTVGLTTPASCTGTQTAITPLGVFALAEVS